MYKKYYKRFLQQNPDTLHFASHSHHYWPDVTRQATLDYWDDSAKWVDEKWGHFFGEKIVELQQRIAQELKLKHPDHIVFAPNTHELLYRLLSCFPANKKIKILTTDSEFYSFSRQIKRLKEDDLVEMTEVATQPFESFQERFIQAAKDSEHDLIFVSHVFFNSGLVVENLTDFVQSLPSEGLVTIDAYHGFMAIPTDLSKIENRIFYLSGSYKYAQGGEGGCFMALPPGTKLRPRYTGWFAELGDLGQEKSQETKYSQGGLRFAGSTIDLTPLYRLQSVFDLLDDEQISTDQIHQWIKSLQDLFIQKLEKNPNNILDLNIDQLINRDAKTRGHFLTFKLPSTQKTLEAVKKLKDKKIQVDSREDRLRFGFGLYHTQDEVEELFKRLEN